MATLLGDDDHYPVYVGIWTNWSHGSILGPVVTLKRRDADLLIAFTAFFIAFVSTCAWRIICFAFYRHYADDTPQKTVYHQCQAVLRNSSDPQGGVQVLARLLWMNRKNQGRARLLSMTIVATICFAAFTAAGGFSSQISVVGPEVLIESMNCGYDYVPSSRSPQHAENKPLVASGIVPTQAEWVNNAVNYAQQCYSNRSAGILDCGRFITKRITAHTDYEANCPFQDHLCRVKSANMRVDSGYIDSHDHLGLNSRPSERMQVRQVLHCAPLLTAGFSSQRNTTIGELTVYHYGNTTTYSGIHDYVGTARSVESQYSYILSPDTIVFSSNYELQPYPVYIKGRTVPVGNASFVPIDSLFRPDADLILIFLAGNGVVHVNSSSDEWYRVSPTQSTYYRIAGSQILSSTLYLPLEPASPLGCAIQYQFCNGNPGNCGPLASLFDAAEGAAPLFDTKATDVISNSTNPVQARFNYFRRAIDSNAHGSLNQVLAQLGPASLTSQSSLSNAKQGQLMGNQWQDDVVHWSDIWRASLQAGFLNTVYFNPSNPSLLATRTHFTSLEQLKICENQKMRSTQHGSFSLFGLLFTFILGFLIIVTSYLLEPVSEVLYKKWGYKKYAHLEWAANAMLQLQRLAHEELGYGTWTKGTYEIPTTEAGDFLGCLDIRDANHPVLIPAGEAHTGETESLPLKVDAPQDATEDAASVTEQNEIVGLQSRPGRAMTY